MMVFYIRSTPSIKLRISTLRADKSLRDRLHTLPAQDSEQVPEFFLD